MMRRFGLCAVVIMIATGAMLFLGRKDGVAVEAGEYLRCSYYGEGNREAATYTLGFVRAANGQYYIDSNTAEAWGLGSYISECPDGGELFRLDEGIYCGVDFDFETNPNREEYPRAQVCDKDTRGSGILMVTREKNIELCRYYDGNGNTKVFAGNYRLGVGYYFSDPETESVIEGVVGGGLDENGCLPVVALLDGRCGNCTTKWYREDIGMQDMAVGGEVVAVFVNGARTDIYGTLLNDSTFVSVQQLCGRIGCDYGYDGQNGKSAKKLTITLDGREVVCDFNSACAIMVDDAAEISRNFSTEVKFIPDEPDELPMLDASFLGATDALIPLRIVGEGLGKQVLYTGAEDGNAPRVDINDAQQKGKIVNVPVDSRPVSRSNFKDVVLTAGWDYVEISSGITDNQRSSESSGIVWVPGNSEAVRRQLLSKAKSNDGANTVVILNLSSYLFGGLVGIRDPERYRDLSAGLDDLRTLISEVPNSKIYITYAIPRTRPEMRIEGLVSMSDLKAEDNVAITSILTGEVKDVRYGTESGMDVQVLENIKLNYEVIFMEYMYLYYFTNGDAEGRINYEMLAATGVPEAVSMRARAFYAKFSKQVKDYLMMYGEVVELLGTLSRIVNRCGERCVLDLGIEDTELPDALMGIGSDNEFGLWPLRSGKGDGEKGNSAEWVLRESGKTATFYGIDEINHIIFAKELLKLEKDVKVGIEVVGGDMSAVGCYDKYSFGQTISFYKSYMGISGGGERTIKAFAVNAHNGSIPCAPSSVLPDWSSVYAAGDTAMVMYYSASHEAARDLERQGAKVWSVPNIGGWNTYANVVGISFARSVAFEVLRHDIEVCMNTSGAGCSETVLSNKLSQQVNAFDRSRMVGVMEDVIYSSDKYGADMETEKKLGDLRENPLVGSIKGAELKIGGYKYNYRVAGINARYPWGRAFEVEILPTLGR